MMREVADVLRALLLLTGCLLVAFALVAIIAATV
jgi:hypothetical protein